MSRIRYMITLLLLLEALPLSGQTLLGYNFTTGVDSTQWITLSNPDTLMTFDRWAPYSPLVELDFPFALLGAYIHSFSVSGSGMVVCNRTYINNIPNYQLSRLCQSYTNPLIFICGQAMDPITIKTMAVCQTVGTPGNRCLVCEITQRQMSDTTQECHFQMQLEESTCAIRFVYGTGVSGIHNNIQVGFSGVSSRFINVSPTSHEASTNDVPFTSSWPGNYRYYQFTPVCANVVGNLTVSHISHNSAKISWTSLSNDSCYVIRYNEPNSSYVELTTRDTSVVINGLQCCTLYDVQLFTICRNGRTSVSVPTQFRTVSQSCSNIPFTSLWDDFVECRTGDVYHPNIAIGVVDSGYLSYYSRHTVHCNTSERDSLTQFQLRTIPVGYCSSVRLGNWMYGGEQESITYTLQVDTNDYNLLLLHYAIVTQNPGHSDETQPHVTFTMTDSVGNSIGECSDATFIPGLLSGWLPARQGSDILWRDWSIYGINLTDYHGQKIKVTISNFDCVLGAHWGYVYFTMEGVSKHLITNVCGANIENTFRAPKGFNYRWYNADSSSVTLSTADTLHVTEPGVYYCRVSYQLAGNTCAFTIAARAGERYPVARFSSTIEDGCGAVRYFSNQSVVASDSAHTQLTNEPCERYLWRFSDGTTDSAINVTHTFGNGTHTVTLIAMLANGACVDSISQTFTVVIPRDTIYASTCIGTPYMFGNKNITEAGEYSRVEDCVEHILFLTIMSDTTTVMDTICMGDTLFLGYTPYYAPGYYTHTFVNQYGCDSIVGLRLTCLPRYSRELYDTLPIGGQYLINDTSFTAPGRYRYRLTSIYGCDSVLDIRLSCITEYDTTICISGLPFVWDSLIFYEAGQRIFPYLSVAGTDSIISYTLHVREFAQPQLIIDYNCDTDLYFIVEVRGGYHYTWLSDSAADNIVTVVEDSLYYIHASEAAYYYIGAEYPDAPLCPATDSIYLDTAGLQPIVVNFTIFPEQPTSETSDMTLIDLSQNILNREWYVNGQLWPETGTTTTVNLLMSDDTIEVCLIGYRRFCQQSVCKKVVITRQSLFFPNVFTPESESNHHFAPVGLGIAEFEMWIYDRRGVLVYHTTDIQQGWDGTSSGIKCRQEVYAYTCRYRFNQELGYHSHTGTILLLR